MRTETGLDAPSRTAWRKTGLMTALAFLLPALVPLGSLAHATAGENAAETLSGANRFANDPAESALIQPGIELGDTDVLTGSFCTANFLFRSVANGTLYLGTADHCVRHLAIGARVSIGGIADGHYAFSLPRAMGLTKDDLHYGEHDFALIEIPAAFADSTSPAVMGYGGPLGTEESEYSEGDVLLAWGNTGLRPAIHKLRGIIYDTTRDFFLWVVMPGLFFGDSGSPVLSPDGNAVGYVKGFDLIVRLDYVLARTNEVGFPVELLTHDSWDPSPL